MKYRLGTLKYEEVKAYMVIKDRPNGIHRDEVVSVHSDKQEALDRINELY